MDVSALSHTPIIYRHSNYISVTPLEPNREREVYIIDGTSADNRTRSLELTPKPLFATVNFKSDTTSSLNSSSSTSSSSHTDTETYGHSKPFVRAPRRRKRTITMELSITTLEKTHETTWVVEELCMSPEDEYCSGLCPFEETTQVSNVVSVRVGHICLWLPNLSICVDLYKLRRGRRHGLVAGEWRRNDTGESLISENIYDACSLNGAS